MLKPLKYYIVATIFLNRWKRGVTENNIQRDYDTILNFDTRTGILKNQTIVSCIEDMKDSLVGIMVDVKPASSIERFCYSVEQIQNYAYTIDESVSFKAMKFDTIDEMSERKSLSILLHAASSIYNSLKTMIDKTDEYINMYIQDIGPGVLNNSLENQYHSLGELYMCNKYSMIVSKLWEVCMEFGILNDVPNEYSDADAFLYRGDIAIPFYYIENAAHFYNCSLDNFFEMAKDTGLLTSKRRRSIKPIKFADGNTKCMCVLSLKEIQKHVGSLDISIYNKKGG